MYHTLGRLISTLWRIKFFHAERVPAEGPVVMVANHRSLSIPAVGFGFVAAARPLHGESRCSQPLMTPVIALNSFPSRGGGQGGYQRL
jgi:hypothetical protein